MNRKVKAAALIAAAALALLPLAKNAAPHAQKAASAAEAGASAGIAQAATPLNQCNFYNEQAFLLNAGANAYDAEGLQIAIVPHYTPAMDMLAGVLAAVSSGGFSRVIIIGPDHEALGSGVSLSGRGWDTPSGTLPGDGEAAKAILANADIRATENHALLQQDHSVSALVPYVARFLPDAEVVTALISKYTALPRLQALAGVIGILCRQAPTLVLCSVDFSHYQTPEDCAAMDKQTVELMLGGDIAAIMQLDYRNLDSPDCVAVALLLAENLGLKAALLDSRVDTYAEDGQILAGSFMAWGFSPAE